MAVAERFRAAVAVKKARSTVVSGSESLTPEESSNRVELFQEGLRNGARAMAMADLIGLCSRTLRRWGIAIGVRRR